jgi:hypothetical protein
VKHTYKNTDLLGKDALSKSKELATIFGQPFKPKTASNYFKQKLIVKYEDNSSGYKTTYGSAYVRLGLRLISKKVSNTTNIKKNISIREISTIINDFLGYYHIDDGEDYHKHECLDGKTLKEYLLDNNVCPNDTLEKLKNSYSEFFKGKFK